MFSVFYVHENECQTWVSKKKKGGRKKTQRAKKNNNETLGQGNVLSSVIDLTAIHGELGTHARNAAAAGVDMQSWLEQILFWLDCIFS